MGKLPCRRGSEGGAVIDTQGMGPGHKLGRYELLVPGTRLMTRYLALQPIYARHPMRRLLIGAAS